MLQFSQYEIEAPLNDCFPYGTIRDISILTGIGASYLAQYTNENDTRKSPTFEFLQIQCALDETNPECGERHWRQVEQFRELSRPRDAKGLRVDTAALDNHKESFDVADAVMKGKPLYDQLTEVCQQIAAAEKHKEAILEAIDQEKTSVNGNNTRYAGAV
jgi:hypothetical protein